MAVSPPVMEDQGRLLEEALGVVRQQSQLMRKCLETPGKLMDALKCGYATSQRPDLKSRNADSRLPRDLPWCLSFAPPV